MKRFIFLVSLNLCAINYAQDLYVPNSHQEHSRNFRKFFCGDEHKRKAVTELPAHLVDVCKKMGVESDAIYVFDQDTKVEPNDAAAFSFGNNIILNKNFWKFDDATQAWYFAHELSHVKHNDIEPFLKQRVELIDVQIGSSLAALGCMGLQLLKRRSVNVTDLVKVGSLWGAVNVVFLYANYAKFQALELRANDEATQAVGVNAAIPLLQEYRWLRDHGKNPTIKRRLQDCLNRLGFCTHGSLELQIERLKAIKSENK